MEAGDPTAATQSAPLAGADRSLATGSVANPDTATRRIERWFRSADTVEELPMGNIGFAMKSELPETEPCREEPTLAEDAPRPGEQDGGDERATIRIRRPTEDRPAAAVDEEELELDPPPESPQPVATWEDAERMGQLLADIEAKPDINPDDDYLPVTHEPYSSPDDETLENTSHCQTELDVGARLVDSSWSENTDEGDSAMAAAIVGVPTRHRSHLVRTLVSTILLGLVGLAAGDYVLMLLYGRSGDLLKIAQYLPERILPASFRGETLQLAAETAEGAPSGGALAGEDARKVIATNDTAATTSPLSSSGAVSANFEAPVAAPASGSGGESLGRRDAMPPAKSNVSESPSSEPARFSDQPAATLPKSAASSVRVRGAPTYTNYQLNRALTAARAAQAGLITGELDDKTIQRRKGASYNKFCDLAEIVTYVDPTRISAAALESELREVDELFRETLTDARIRTEVARIAPIWISSPTRRHGGIFFAGTVRRVAERGSVAECQFDTGAGEPLTILVPPPIADRLADGGRTLIVVGSLVDRPADRAAGYTGAASRAVWVSRLVPVAP